MFEKLILLAFPLTLQLYSVLPPKEADMLLFSPQTYLDREKWVDSTFQTLDLDKKIGQLFMAAAYSNKDEKHHQQIEELIEKHNIGGLMFMQGGPVRQAHLTNRYQAKARLPLMIAMDAEWGLSMRLDSTIVYPKAMTLGALESDSLIYIMGKHIAQQCRRLGVHINFAPVIDINSNSQNPVIGIRSFGQNREKVSRKGVAYMQGLQENGIMAVAKHFPGHGDTQTDSHLSLPTLHHGTSRLDSVELFPFVKLIRQGLEGVMVAHLHIPVYESKKNTATTLSKYVVTNLLKEKLHFDGLVFTDALNMKGVSAFHTPGELELLAYKAGNDILLFAENIPETIKVLRKYIKGNKSRISELDQRVKKILRAKYKMGLHQLQPVELTNLQADLHKASYNFLNENLFKTAITVVARQANVLPAQHLDLYQYSSLSINGTNPTLFQEILEEYVPFKHFEANTRDSLRGFDPKKYLKEIDSTHTLVIGLFGVHNFSVKKAYGLDPATLQLIETFSKRQKVILCVFGNPYTIQFFKNIPNIICGYEENLYTLRWVPQAIFGGISSRGKLPISVGPWPEGHGVRTELLKRLEYGVLPEQVDMQTEMLLKADSIIYKAIQDRETPGAQLLVARHGKVIWNKAYGHYTYERIIPVTKHTLYDIASITKVAGTLQAIMFLYDQGKINLSEIASIYLPEVWFSNKRSARVRDILLHQAGFIPFVPYWTRTLDKSRQLSEKYYAAVPSDTFPLQVASHLYGHYTLEEQMWRWTLESKLLDHNPYGGYPYEYSDLSFYFLKRIAEKQLNQPLRDFVEQNFFKPIGAHRLLYQPLRHFDPNQIAPTEYDRYFRQRLLVGTVHDPGAAMMGGVGGHAGLFASASDLAKLLQMNLQGGSYGGHRFILPQTLKLFTSQQFAENRRGLGWDKPPRDQTFAYISRYASEASFGHSGYTGTVVWMDPQYDLLIVFLSNRVYPNDDHKMVKNHTRRKIQDVIYQSIMNPL